MKAKKHMAMGTSMKMANCEMQTNTFIISRMFILLSLFLAAIKLVLLSLFCTIFIIILTLSNNV